MSQSVHTFYLNFLEPKTPEIWETTYKMLEGDN